MKIEDNFKFNNNDIIVVGCSSGPDSMALLDMLLKIKDKYNLKIIVAHVNHNVRSQSEEEEIYMKEYCNSHNLICETMKITEYGDDNFHNEARNIRYHFYDELMKKYSANYLMTAHHGDDLMETILMRIVRGSNLFGYGGFKMIVDCGTYKLVRPLITYTKAELIDYDNKNNVKYYIDDTNSSDLYTRNRYRKYMLPFLKKEDKNVHLKFLKFSNNLYDAAKFVARERDKAIDKILDNNKINLTLFKEIDPYLQREILYYLLNKCYPDDLVLLNDKHIDLIMKMIYSKKPNEKISLPNEVMAIKSYTTLELKRDTDIISGYEVEFNRYVDLPNNHKIELIEDTSLNTNNICRLNSSEITLPLIVRTRRLGDKIRVLNMAGTKKVKDIFIDKKISKEDRDIWPVVVDSSNKIVWLPGLKKSNYNKKKEEVYDIVLQYK